MTAPVDFLFNMRDAAMQLGVAKQQPAALRLLDAHDVMAELIQADKEYDVAVAEAKELIRRIAENGWFELEFDALRKSGDRVVRAQMLRARVLSRIGGAA